MNHQKQALKNMNFLFKACKYFFTNVLTLLTFAQKICNGTADAMTFKFVKITLVIVAIMFVELSIPIALMSLKMLNSIQSNFLTLLVNYLKMLNSVTSSIHKLIF